MITLARFARAYLLPYLHWYLAGSLALAATNWLTVTIPLYLAAGIDAIALGPEGQPILRSSAMWVAVMGVAVIGVRTASRLLFFTPGRLVEAQVRQDLFARLLRQQPVFLDQWPTGDLVSRASSDITMVRLLAGFAALGIVNTTVALALCGTQMWRISPRLAVLTAIPLLCGMAVTVLAAGRLRTLMRRLQEQAAVLSDQILSSFQGVATIHGFRAESAFQERFEVSSVDWLTTVLQRANLRAVIGPMLSLAAAFNVFLLLYVGGPMALRGEITVGELVAFTALVAILVSPLRGLSFIVTLFRQAQASLDRIDAVLLPEIDRPDLPNPLAAPTVPPAIEVRDLTFTYPGASSPALQQVSVRVEGGQTLGILGTTGSGKTTLLRCLSRLYNPPPGTVFIDGRDLLEIDLDAWRRTAQLVPQRALLFTETVHDNVLRGGDPERLPKVLELAALGPDLNALPNHTQTVVGEAGLTLSGGQRQRVALARGLVREGTVLMLDDVLSAVDHATEQQLIDSLRSQGSIPTTVIVSNRCSALKHADVILVMHEGRITATGTHDALIEQEGMYREVWIRQSDAHPTAVP